MLRTIAYAILGVMAFEAANEGTAVKGYRFDLLVLDDGTATAGHRPPAGTTRPSAPTAAWASSDRRTAEP